MDKEIRETSKFSDMPTAEEASRFRRVEENVRFAMYKRFCIDFRNNLEEDRAKILAVQVINYLMGDDFDKKLQQVDASVQEKILTIKRLIIESADKEMQTHEDVHSLILATIFWKSMAHYLYTHTIGEWDTTESENAHNIVRKYDVADNPLTKNFLIYTQAVGRFISGAQD